jgi:hypothetical protein
MVAARSSSRDLKVLFDRQIVEELQRTATFVCRKLD